MKIIAGPCQLEEDSIEVAKYCKRIVESYGMEYYFKASFDKANRTSLNSQRGLGVEQSMPIFDEIRREVGCKIVTDVHTTGQVAIMKEVVDVLQIPAFLCRQTDLLLAAKGTGKIVNVKKGQFLAPWDVAGITSKIGEENVWITERGTSFGYNTLVNDFTGLQYIAENHSLPIIFDATHSVQKPGGLGNVSGGNRDYVPALVRAAVATGFVSGIFMEVHPDPDNAPSDGPNSLHLHTFERIIKQIQVMHDIGVIMGVR
jgi:2-dehydro-3-deoxyphosphooctonate aldolase (KDO 8-P synthase)